MIRSLLHLLFLVILLTLQVSFIHALPYPFDRVPLILVVTVYLYQYCNQTSTWWWLIFYGFALDVLAISIAPFEIISYTLTTFTMTLLVAHVFTNRSFYSMATTALLSLLVLLISELLLIGASHLFTSITFQWKETALSQLWAMAFACFLLLFIFPSVRRVSLFAQRFVLERI